MTSLQSKPAVHRYDLFMHRYDSNLSTHPAHNSTSPTEEHSIAAVNASLFTELLALTDRLQQRVFSPTRGKDDKEACTQATANGAYWGPFL